MTSVMRWGGLAVLAGGLILARPVAAQDLKETQDRLRVEAQKLEAVVKEALSRSRDIGRTNPMRALEVLRDAKAQLAADKEALTAERREILDRQLFVAMRVYDGNLSTPVVTPGKTGPSSVRPNPQEEDNRRVQDEANRRFKEGNKGREQLEDLNRQRNEAFNQSQLALLKSIGIPAYRDISYPSDWLEKTKRRSQMIQLTDREKAIVKSLNERLTIEVEGKTFKEVLDELRERTKLPIIVDQRALDELNITYNTPINLSLSKVTTRTVLKRLLGDLNLTYVMKDEAIQITSPARAKEMLTVRVYSVADLMPAADMRMPAVLTQLQGYQTLQMIVVLILQTVEPDSWEVNGKGGLGTIQFDPIRFALIVKQTAEMHYLLGLSAGVR